MTTRCRNCDAETESPFEADWGLVDSEPFRSPEAHARAWCCPACYEKQAIPHAPSGSGSRPARGATVSDYQKAERPEQDSLVRAADGGDASDQHATPGGTPAGGATSHKPPVGVRPLPDGGPFLHHEAWGDGIEGSEEPGEQTPPPPCRCGGQLTADREQSGLVVWLCSACGKEAKQDTCLSCALEGIWSELGAGRNQRNHGPDLLLGCSDRKQHFSGTSARNHEESEIMSENGEVQLEDKTVAKVGLEPTTTSAPKRRGRPKGSKNRQSLQKEECRDGGVRTNGQRLKYSEDTFASEGRELAVAVQVTRALGMVEGAIASLAQVDHENASALHPDQLLWLVKGLAALREAERWLAPVVSVSLGKPQVNSGTPVKVFRGGGESVEGTVQRTADNWIQVELSSERWRGWFDLRTGLMLDRASWGPGVNLSDLFRLDLDSLPDAEG